MICHVCGKENGENHQFCMNCGAKLGKPQEDTSVKPAADADTVLRYAAPAPAPKKKHKSVGKILLIVSLGLAVLAICIAAATGLFGGNSEDTERKSDSGGITERKSDSSEDAERKSDSDYLCFTALLDNATVEMHRNGDAPEVSLRYSTDLKNWQDFYVDQTVIVLEKAGDKVWFRGDNPNGFANNVETEDAFGNKHNNISYNEFFLGGYVTAESGNIMASGNIMSLLCSEDFSKLSSVPSFAFYGLFSHCGLETAPELPATELADGCYTSMFASCVSLTEAPELPATKLANWCYESMFEGCRKLKTAPELPATELAKMCYMGMFRDCSLLEIAPELPATELADSCYSGMFHSCISLKEAPELPAAKLAEWCYSEMFDYCLALEAAPELPATELAEHCYRGMFDGCASLKSVMVGFDTFEDLPDEATYDWLEDVAETGTFTWAGGDSGDERRSKHTVPKGWSIASN